MNDEFLTRFRKPPRQEFVAALYKRINLPMNKQPSISFRRTMAALALGMVLIAIFASSETVRAAFQALMKEIGGITYLEPEATAYETTPAPEEQATVRQERISLSEFQENGPFEMSLPTWAPEGFVMGETVTLSYFNETMPFADVQWLGPDLAAGPIILMVGPRVSWQVDVDHVQEIQINGQPAGLTGGGWDADTGEWGGAGADNLTLTWMRGDLMYQLRSPAVTAEELIRMAESIP
jgi:hypothetical protein